MSVFSSERPISTQELMNNMVKANAERQANLTLLNEQKLLESEESEKQGKLKAQDDELKKKEEREKSLNALKQSKRVSDSKKAVAEATMKLPKIARDSIIKKTLFNIMIESLWIDDNVKNTDEMQMKALKVFENTISLCDKATGQSFDKAMNNTKLLSYINEIATTEGKNIANRIISEAAETEEISINFKMNQDEINKIDEKMGELGTKEISKEIKKKVLSVVEDEKKSGKVKAELFAELDEANKDDDDMEGVEPEDGTNPEATSESIDHLRLRLIKENANRKLASISGSSIFESLMMSSFNKIDNSNAVFESGNSLLDSEKNNAALLQTILEYTILETFNTLKVYDFNLRNVNQLKRM